MATVAQILDDGRYNDLETNAVPEFPLTLIHSDIKPLNSKWLPQIPSNCNIDVDS